MSTLQDKYRRAFTTLTLIAAEYPKEFKPLTVDQLRLLARGGMQACVDAGDSLDSELKDPLYELTTVLRGLVAECEYSASSGIPFNFPDGQGKWTQLAKAKALISEANKSK